MREEAVLLFCDDKANIHIGEPGTAVSTGVRGKKTLAPVNTVLSALDHDMSTKGSLTPSVILECKIPLAREESFVRGKVHVAINDSVYQTSSPFRHAAMLSNMMPRGKYVLLKFTDGGTDQRNTLEAVKCASICLFKELDLDLLVLCRCAPGQSWKNPAERCMCLLNLGIQNCSLERHLLDDASEKEIKKCNGMSDLRKRKESLGEKWQEAIAPVQEIMKDRFERLALKEDKVRCMEPVSDLDVDLIMRHLRELFPSLDLSKLQKVHTKKCEEYLQWMNLHARERTYSFQIRKCDDGSCCSPKHLEKEQLNWVPDPELKDPEHFFKYDEVLDKETSEKDLPSLSIRKAKKNDGKKPSSQVEPVVVQAEVEPVVVQAEVEPAVAQAEPPVEAEGPSQEPPVDMSTVTDSVDGKENELPNFTSTPGFNKMYTAQHARMCMTCVECRKPRVIYGKHQLSEHQKISLVLEFSQYDYTCGSPILPPEHNLVNKVTVRPDLSCAQPMEIPYYSSNLGRKDLCGICGTEESLSPLELKQQFKTVLPICNSCTAQCKSPITQRPYGLHSVKK
jgi:hypothetical protein